jgi:hypothetical protein
VYPLDEITFYKDITWIDDAGTRHSRQEIFDKILSMIAGARNVVILDMFLFNDFIGEGPPPYRKLAEEITNALVAQKVKFPELFAVVITDPINTVYNSLTNRYLEKLKSENIHVVVTRLEPLRDSNPVYSALWRILKPFGNVPGVLLPNPFGKGRVFLHSYLAMLNFKANHRKLIICDEGDSYSALITSANPHDGSSAHGNVALYFKSPAVFDLVQSEQAILDFSGGLSLPAITPAEKANTQKTAMRVQIVTERKIKDALIATLKQAGKGDTLSMMVFYLSDREIIRELKKAFHRGASVRILLDPNKDAFGRKKNGIPNRPVAAELVKSGIPVRWSNTHGEQSHTKMLLAEYKQGQNVAIVGSANFTRRNLNNLNLETDIAVFGPADSYLFNDMREFINSQWNNKNGIQYSLDYSEYADSSLTHQFLYRWMEGTGMSTF